MNKKIKMAVLKILLLEQEFTKKELSEAVTFISKSSEKNILDYLSNNKSYNTKKEVEKPTKFYQPSKTILNLKKSDNEKYELLAPFEFLLKKGELLPTLSDINKIALTFSKDFRYSKSRKASIPKLMALLSEISTDELLPVINGIIESSDKTDSEYADLAAFLMGEGNGG